MRTANVYGLCYTALSAFLVFTVFQMYTISFRNRETYVKPEYLERAHHCLAANFAPLNTKQYWDNFSQIVNKCSEVRHVRIINLDNSDERKHFQRPARNIDNPFIKECTAITLGIGHDIQSEIKLRDQYPHCKFYGADPMREVNEKLYTSIGKYFQVAVGGLNGYIKTDILNASGYTTVTIKAIDLTTFLKNNIDRKIIDSLWVDIEHSEYDLFPLLLESGAPYKEGYRFCQINVEVHGHANDQSKLAKFSEFVKNVLKEKQYTIFHAMQSVHIRTFLVNYKDPECFKRFFETIKWND